MAREDEESFLRFLREGASIQLFESFMPMSAELAVANFADEMSGHWLYRIWNQSFPWTPQYGTVGPRAEDPNMVGWAYLSNASTAPLLELSRSDPSHRRAGRLYWARNVSAPDGLDYDADAFSRWVDTIWAWCRGSATKEPRGDRWAPYVFPAARRTMVGRPAAQAQILDP